MRSHAFTRRLLVLQKLRIMKENWAPDPKWLFLCISYRHKSGMKYGCATVSTDGQSVDAQVRQLAKAGRKKVYREVASGAKTDRAQLRRLLDVLDAGDDGDQARPAGAINPQPVEHSRGDHRQERRSQIRWRQMGRHQHIARAADADLPGRPGGL
jgi:hypothetical protein